MDKVSHKLHSADFKAPRGACPCCRKPISAPAQALDGIYVLRTNLPASKSLARVERAFRSLKTVDLELRPVFHWTAPRVRAHVLLCMLADHLGCQLSRRRRVPRLAGKRTDQADGEALPVHSFRMLLADLARLTCNVVRIGRDRVGVLLASPTPLQRQLRSTWSERSWRRRQDAPGGGARNQLVASNYGKVRFR